MRKRAETGILMLAAAFFLLFTGISMNYYRLSAEPQTTDAINGMAVVELSAGESQGTIYDREMLPMTNTKMNCRAAVVPSLLKEDISGYMNDPADYRRKLLEGEPFVIDCREDTPESEGVTVFEIPQHYAEEETAPHLIGYLSQGAGISGIEYAYDRLLRQGNLSNTVSYSADGFGRPIVGDGKSVTRSTKHQTGVVTTIDSRIQSIIHREGKAIKKGAIVVSEVGTGDILGLSSFPEFDRDDINGALNDKDSPLINRALYSYSVGSAFKLVTACEALSEGAGGYVSDCTGSTDISGQIFACHKTDGHGVQDLTEAMTNSCNTYFIQLSRTLDLSAFRRLAFDMGFGREIHLCAGMTSSAGVLPTVEQLQIPAELANFSFGQGKLTATPLQVNQLTSAIAGGGELSILRLIRGITLDGRTVANEKSPQRTQVIDPDIADELRQMMILAVRNNESSNAFSDKVTVGAKTSTAQTGRYTDDGEELCNAWITGFFPAYTPRYVVTVLVEDGGYGNEAAAPVFRRIAEKIAELPA